MVFLGILYQLSGIEWSNPFSFAKSMKNMRRSFFEWRYCLSDWKLIPKRKNGNGGCVNTWVCIKLGVIYAYVWKDIHKSLNERVIIFHYCGTTLVVKEWTLWLLASLLCPSQGESGTFKPPSRQIKALSRPTIFDILPWFQCDFNDL